MGAVKPAVQSLTIWAALVVIVAQMVKLFWGYDMTADDQQLIVSAIQQGVEVATTGVSVVAGLLALWGRVRAKHQVSGVLKSGG